jgi:hypothetical protein
MQSPRTGSARTGPDDRAGVASASAQKGPEMEAATCATCPWWSQYPERVEYRMDETGTQLEIRSPNERGECRKYPPRASGEFPVTDSDDWCGEHPERRLPGDA